jgi:hypothetical protein
MCVDTVHKGDKDDDNNDNNNNIKVQNIQHGKYDYVPRTVTTEQLQHNTA